MAFSIENQESNKAGAKQPKQIFKNPQDKHFFGLHFMADINTKRLGIAGQVLSGITEFIAVSKMLNFEFPVFQVYNLLPIFSALFAVYLFEWLGVRVYLVQIVRTFARKNKDEQAAKKWENKFLLFTNIFFLVILIIGSLVVSLVGEKGLLIEKTTATADTEVFKLNEERAEKIAVIQNRITTNQNGATEKNTTEKQLINDQYNLDVQTEKDRLKLEIAAIKEASKNSEAIQFFDKKKLDANNRSRTILSKLKTQRKEDLKEINHNYDSYNDKAMIVQINESYDKRIESLEKKAGTKAGFWKILDGSMFFLLIVFMVLSWLSIAYDEVYKSGSQMEIHIEEIDTKPNLLELLFERLNHWLYHIGYVVITSLLGSVKFTYDKPESYTKKYEQKPLEFSLPSFRKKREQFREIGFRTENKNDVSNCDTKNNIETKTETQDSFWAKYTQNGIRQWYKRGVLGIDSSGRKVGSKSKAQNREKYEKVRNEMMKYNIKYTEKKDTISFK